MRSEFEKNRYWIGLFKTDVEFNGLLGEFGRYELNGSRDVDHRDLEDFNSKWEAYAKAWQHQQSKVDELQKRVDAVIRLLVEAELYQSEPNIDLAVQALKGEQWPHSKMPSALDQNQWHVQAYRERLARRSVRVRLYWKITSML